MYHICIHSSVGGHVSSFHALVIVSSAAVNIRVSVSSELFSLDMSRSGIAES